MKTKTFQMRMSAETKAQLNTLKQKYQMSASAVICMLISKEVMKFKEETK
jgi:hypothetical protein